MKTLHLASTSASSPSFALISVLALVSLAALTATAFLASARLERQATMPLTQTTQLEMALNAGVNAAKEMLDYAPSKHFNFVTTYWRGAGTNDWTNELGYLLSGAVRSESIRTSTIVNYYCCFSTATLTNLGTNPSATIVVSNDITNQGTFLSQMSNFMYTQTNFTSGQSTNIPLLGDTPTNRHTSPPVGWIYINQNVRVKPGSTNTTNVPVARFAFFVQDLCGLIDAQRMGGLTNSSPYRDSAILPTNYIQGTNPAEISLTNLTGTVLTNASQVSTFTSTTNRIKYLSPGMLVLSNGGRLNTNDLRYVTTGLRHWTNAYERIPVGLGYADSWTNKCNLNNSANLTLTNISNVISKNLTMFTNRGGGFSNAYASALAANIIDYIDTDSQPTFTNIGGVNIRGVEALPFVNERVTFFSVVQTNASTNGFITTILSQDFYEFWNPANKTTLPVSLSIVASNNLQFSLGSFDAPFAATNSSGQNVAKGITTNSFAIPSISPNGFYVTNSLMVTNFFLSPGAFAPAFPLTYNQSQNFFSYKVYLGSVNTNNLYDQTLLGCYVSSSGTLPLNLNNSSANNRRFFGSYSAFAAQTPLNTFRTSVGDPRMMFYLNDNQDQITYATGSSFGGRNVRSGITTSSNYYQVSIPFWPDGGHDSPAGNAAGTSFPNAVPLAAYTNAPPGRISDSGTLTNIFELGAIYDPIQWRDPTFKTASGFGSEPNGGQWTILTANATADNKYGGGTSLRIGRAEHPRFAWTNLAGATVATPNMMMSSAALLDLFSITNQYDESGQINLNTAPAPVLRALAGSIYLRSDPGLLPGGTNFSTPTAMVEAFTQGVMRFRAQYPFYSPSQLPFIGTDPSWPNTNTWPTNSVFGNTNRISLATNSVNSLTNTSLGVTEWSDQAAEEWFAKIFKLSTTYSRNFRVYVIAQKATNSPNGNIGVGPIVRKYYNVVTRQNTDGANDVPPASASTFNSFESSY